MSINLKEVMAEGSTYEIDLAKLLGVSIVKVTGYVSCEFGDDTPVFQINKIHLENGKHIWLQAEHDIAYLPAQGDNVPNLSEEVLTDLYQQQEA